MSNYNYIIGGRSTGKTRKLLEHAKENNAAVVCRNPSAMARKAAAYGIFGVQFVSYDEVVNLIHDDFDFCDNFVIDEAKDFLDFLFAGNCLGFTQTEDN
jgi:hypothetical protein